MNESGILHNLIEDNQSVLNDSMLNQLVRRYLNWKRRPFFNDNRSSWEEVDAIVRFRHWNQVEERDVWKFKEIDHVGHGQLDGFTYYHVDFYETIMGELHDDEILGTDGAFNCMPMAFRAVKRGAERVDIGLTHQHTFHKRTNPNVDQIFSEIGGEYQDVVAVLSFQEPERSLLENEIEEYLKLYGFKALAVCRGGFSNTHAEMAVSSEGVSINYTERATWKTWNYSITWEKINELLKTIETILFLDPRELF